VFDVAPKLNNDDVLPVEPKAGNDGTEVGGLSIVVGAVPNEAVAPNAGGVVVLLVEITEGANGFSGLLAPNANGALLDVVVVVPADGKLKPDDGDDKPIPNKDAADVVAVFVVVVVAIEDVAASGKLPGYENPLIVEETGNVKEAVVVVSAVALDEKANKLEVVDEVVIDDDDDNGTKALVPNENRGGLSDEIVEETVVVAVVVANEVLPNDPNVIDVGIFIGDDDVVDVVIIEGMVEVLVAGVVFVDVNEPNDWNAGGVFIPI
jgi:hypothetical protein